MIQRFCFAKLADADVPARDAYARELAQRFADAGATAVVAVPADESAARWDLAIEIRCDALADWQALAARPAIAAIFDELQARAPVVKAWTFQAVQPAQP